MTSTTERRTDKRRILVPLATLLGAAAVAAGSGATFTSQSAHAVSVTSGVLSQSNTRDGQTLQVTNLQPGGSANGTLTINNTGSIDSTLTLEETASTDTFSTDALSLTIAQGSTVLWTGNFGDLAAGTKLPLGALPVGGSTTVSYTVAMAAGAGNENQGQSASASYQWVQTQTNAPASVTSWVAGLLP